MSESVKQVLAERGVKYGAFIGVADVAQQLKAVVKEMLDMRDKTLLHDQQEALDMIFHKVARIVNGDSNYVDNWIDIAGYAQLVADRLNESE